MQLLFHTGWCADDKSCGFMKLVDLKIFKIKHVAALPLAPAVRGVWRGRAILATLPPCPTSRTQHAETVLLYELSWHTTPRPHGLQRLHYRKLKHGKMDRALIWWDVINVCILLKYLQHHHQLRHTRNVLPVRISSTSVHSLTHAQKKLQINSREYLQRSQELTHLYQIFWNSVHLEFLRIISWPGDRWHPGWHRGDSHKHQTGHPRFHFWLRLKLMIWFGDSTRLQGRLWKRI